VGTPQSNLKNGLIISFLVLISVNLAVYWGSLSSYYIPPDDFHHISNWKFGMRNVLSAFSSNTDGDTGSGGHYRPFELLSFMLDDLIWEDSAFGRHLTNLVLQIINSILVFRITWILTRNGMISLLAGLLFAVHPAHSSAVAWLSGRTDLIAGTFCLASLLLFARFLERGMWLLYGLSLLSFFFGLLSKESAFTLPILALLFELLIARRSEKAPAPGEIRPPRAPAEPPTPRVRLKVVFGTVGAILLVTGIIMSREFIEAHLVPDRSISPTTEPFFALFRYYLIFGGLALLTLAILIPQVLRLFRRLPQVYSIGFFTVFFIYLPVRVTILGGFGGYNFEFWNNVSAHLQVSFNSLVRDFYGILALFWPTDFGYVEKILFFQKDHPLIYHSLFVIALAIASFLILKHMRKDPALLFAFLMIPISIAPVHNILIRNTYYDPRYLYMPSVGAVIFIALLIMKIGSKRLLQSRLIRTLGGATLLLLVLLSAISLRQLNRRFYETGEVMREFVKTIEENRDLMNREAHLYFLTFPYLPIDIDRHVWVTAVLPDAINFAMDAPRWKLEDMSFGLFIDEASSNDFSIAWHSGSEIEIGNLDLSRAKIITADPISDDLDLTAIYDPSWKDPHPRARSLISLRFPARTEMGTIDARWHDGEHTLGAVKMLIDDTGFMTPKEPVFFIYKANRFVPITPPADPL